MDPDLLRQAGWRLESWPRTMILSHERPDGDAIGALAGMRELITAAGRVATPYAYSPLPARYQFMEPPGGTAIWPADPAPLEHAFNGILIVDTCSWTQLEPAAAFLKSSRLPRIIIDHHATADQLAAPGSDALYVIDATAASICGVLYELARAMGWAIPPAAADALFAGIATDTGWFRFPSTDARTLRAAADLIAGGVRPDLLHARLLESYSPARLRLKAEMLATLQWHAGGALAVMWLTQDMFRRSGASAGDTEDLVNEPLSVGEVVAAVLLTDMGDGHVRVNLRSKSPELSGRDVDVAGIAQALGGGGHRRAAGARLAGSLEQVREYVVGLVLAALAAGGAPGAQQKPPAGV